MRKLWNSLVAWLVAHPVVEHFLEVVLWAGVMGVVTYVKTTQQFELSACGMAFVLALKLAINQQKGTLIAYLQDQLQALQNVPNGVSTATALNQVPIPKSAALSAIIRPVLVLFFLSVLGVSAANAGYLISNPKSEKVGLSLPSGTSIYLMPIEGFDVGASLPNPTYGLSLNEDFVLGQQTTGANGATNLSPLFGIGGSLYLDGAGVINNNGPLYLLVGVNAIGPDLDLLGLGNGQGLVPQGMFTHNFVTGEDKITGGLTVFADLGPGTAQKITP
jgi:hypothetical protein